MTKITYSIPEDETILAFAEEICEGFADHYEDDSYADKGDHLWLVIVHESGVSY